MNYSKRRGLCERTQPFEGLVEVWVHQKGELVDFQSCKNIVLFQGNSEVIRALSTTIPTVTPRVISRMAVGDLGTIPSDPTVPKVPVKSATGLFHEIYRKNIDSYVQTLYSTVAIVYTGDTTLGSNIILNLSSTSGVVVGMVVSGTGIPAGSVVSAVLTASSIQISNSAISSNVGADVNFVGTVNECQFIATFDSTVVPLTAFANPSQPRVNEVSLIIVDPTAAIEPRPAVAAPNAVLGDEVAMTLRTFKSVPFEAANDTTITIRYTIFTE